MLIFTEFPDEKIYQIWVDRTQDSQHRIDDLMLVLNDFTLNNPIAVDFKASIEGKSLAAEGKLGPLGQNPGLGVLPVDLAVSLLNTFTGQIKGKFINLLENPSYDLELQVQPFSAREFFASLDIDFPVVTADPTTFRSVGVDITAKGDKEKVSIEKGRIKVDDTLLDISLLVTDFDHPNLGFTVDIDHLDLDRYLAPEAENNNEQNNLIQSGRGANDYSAWRKINLVGAMQVKELKLGGGTVNDINIHLKGADGIFAVDPSFFGLCQGRAQTTLTVDFQSETPQTSIELKAQGVQARPLLHDFVTKDFLGGTVDTDIRLSFSGNNADAIKKSLDADGTLIVKDGVLEGIDLVSAKRNMVDSPSGSDSSSQKIRTDFSELKSIFAIRNGLVDSRETTLKSPSASVLISGTADLVSERLALMIGPKVVVVMKGEQGKEKDTSMGSVPFALSGTFTKPTISIDAQYLSSEELELPAKLNMQSLVDQKLPSPVDEDVRDLVGTTLIDPAVVAQRFGLQPEVIRKGKVKNSSR